MPGAEDTYASYGIPWANLSNTPFRLYKHWVHEGGIATPLILHGPKDALTAEGLGGIVHRPGQLPDIMATCLDAAGAVYPETRDGKLIPPCEGWSLLPLREGRDNGRGHLVWEHEGNAAYRKGRWKIVRRHPLYWELYDMEEDRSELRNLVDEHPMLVRELEAEYLAWAERVGVEDWTTVRNALRGGA